MSSADRAIRQPHRRPSLSSLLLSGALYWAGFRRRRGEAAVCPPRRDGPATSRPAPFTAVRDQPHSARDVASHIWTNIGCHRVLAIAAGVTFYALLAIFPAIAAIVALYGLFADTHTIVTQVNSMAGVLPGGAIAVIGDQVGRIVSRPSSSLGFTFIVSLLISLWSANAGMKAMFDALNVVYNAEERRSFIKLNAVSVAFTLAAIALLLAAMASVVVVPIVLNALPMESLIAPALGYTRWPLLLILIGLGLSVIYRFGPDREHAQWRWISWGSALAAIAWLAASLLFSWYAANFGSYNETYGSLGAVIGFMTWMWLSSIVVLLGAEIDAVMERWDRGSAH
ncbi:MAG TPA: YihY/virulence factor BrkB family protein [Pseudolabrys sp.]|uniref:YihY/virulence factor BrkB family protein n=1 Tax=Pseudolabrys sp. TaxID=1960880 RepID=UPI002DDDA245|nr:YihY/virulence factor BrkB family protein [Pseudolabrys sp.]HEV2629564.1 YihY/virulence factor BrkB family protein [Pseudolabrys sp.]